MIVIIGLSLLIVSAILAVAGVITNNNSAHPLNGDFALFGQHMSGLSTGRLFLYGIIVGVVGVLGLSLLRIAFTRSLASRGLQRELKKSRDETASLRLDYERLTQQINNERTERLATDTLKTFNTRETPSSDE